MDDQRFDTLARVLGRRQAITGVTSGFAVAFGFHAAETDAKKKTKKKCAQAGQTTSKKRKKCCALLTRDASGVCVSSTPPPQCPTCSGLRGTCFQGVCTCDVCASGCPFSSVQSAVAAASSGGSITICPGDYSGNVVVERDLTLIGAGRAGTGKARLVGGSSSVVTIAAGTTVTLQDLSITGGQNVQDGGGIYNAGTLTVTRCSVNGYAGGYTRGGGIFNAGTLTLTDSEVTANTTSNLGSGIYNDGGLLTLSNSSVSQNTGGSGAGIFTDGGIVDITGSTIDGNTAPGSHGGGIANYNGPLTLTNSTISGNTSSNGGGLANMGSMTLVRSIVRGNIAASGEAGGIYNDAAADLTLDTSTVTNNRAGTNGGGIYNLGYIDCSDNSTVISNTKGNPPVASDCVNVSGGSGCASC